MILTGRQIREKIGKEVIIEPYFEERVNPNSYNLTLHNELMVYEDDVLDMKKKSPTKTIAIPKEGYVLQPGKIYLARTIERTYTDKYVPMLEGRSSIGRLGLFIHSMAGFGDVGFNGTWTLHLSCIQPIRIYAGIEIAQLYYHSIEGECDLYNDKYQNKTEIMPSKLYEELECDEKVNL